MSRGKASALIRGKKEGKLSSALLPMEAIEEVLKVINFGAEKHSPNGWRDGNFPYSIWTDAAFRHDLAIREGEDRAEDSGLLHAAHAACNYLFLTYYQLKGIGIDDRYKPVAQQPPAKAKRKYTRRKKSVDLDKSFQTEEE